MFQIIFFSFILSVNIFANECSNCHKDIVENYKTNLHYTLKNAINITRKTWGIKDSNVTLQTLPNPNKDIKKPSDLVDDFLRRKCLKCHLQTKAKSNNKKHNEVNCLACHTKHNKNSKKVVTPMQKCLNCHNKNFIGSDFLGLFPKDHNRLFRAPISNDGSYPEQKYGIDFHHLQSDVHFQKGFSCVNCHNSNNMHKQKKITCKDCHANLSPKNHQNYHTNISCSACHSSWNNSSYELSVFRDDIADYEKWKDLTLQEDVYLQKFLTKALRKNRKTPPVMPDWINGEIKDGIWYSGYRYKRWEDFILANDQNGKIKIVRPIFQYRISYRDKNGTIIFDDVSKIDNKKIEAWTPYTPHTISKRAKSCEMCHSNPLILNQKRTNVEVLDLKIPNQIVNGYKLNKSQLQKMQSKKYKKERAKIFFNLK